LRGVGQDLIGPSAVRQGNRWKRPVFRERSRMHFEKIFEKSSKKWLRLKMGGPVNESEAKKKLTGGQP